jgi:hypothetical protein
MRSRAVIYGGCSRLTALYGRAIQLPRIPKTSQRAVPVLFVRPKVNDEPSAWSDGLLSGGRYYFEGSLRLLYLPLEARRTI